MAGPLELMLGVILVSKSFMRGQLLKERKLLSGHASRDRLSNALISPRSIAAISSPPSRVRLSQAGAAICP
jgi:hypothetical protein